MEGDGPECFPPREDDEPNGSQSDSVMHEVNGNIQEKLNYGLKYMQRVAQQLVYDIFKCRHEKTRHMFAGTILQLHEHLLGNETTAHSTSAKDSLKRSLKQFTRNMSSQTMFVQDNETRHKKENVMTEQPVLEQARPKGSNGGNRNKSRNEWILSGGSVKDSSRKKAVCSLCSIAGHRVSRNCSIVKEHKAQVIGQRETSMFAHRLGNPEHHLAQRAGKSTRENIKQWQRIPKIGRLYRTCGPHWNNRTFLDNGKSQRSPFPG